MTNLRLVVSAVVLVALGACSDYQSEKRPYILATATPGGTYYPVGVAIATITKAELYDSDGISLSAISSAGSMENIKLMRDNQAQFAILQGMFSAWAWNGDGPVSRPQPWLRTIAVTWQNPEHFVLLSSLADSGTITDLNRLDGERFVLGARNSGAGFTGAHILSALGVDYEAKFSLAWMGFSATASAIQDGAIVGMNVPGGIPISAVAQAMATMGDELTILEFTDEQLVRINAQYPLWSRYLIPADTYPNQPEPINDIAHPNILAVHADIPDDAVYKITRAIFENLESLHQIHAATREMTLEGALKGLGAPLHPGAVRYYREQEITIPSELLPP